MDRPGIENGEDCCCEIGNQGRASSNLPLNPLPDSYQRFFSDMGFIFEHLKQLNICIITLRIQILYMAVLSEILCFSVFVAK